jgi:hypothetical protein
MTLVLFSRFLKDIVLRVFACRLFHLEPEVLRLSFSPICFRSRHQYIKI